MIGGKSFQRDCDVLSVECYNTKKRKSREMFTLPSCDNYVNCDCVTLKVPITNKDINFNDVLLFDKWIMWWFFEREKKHKWMSFYVDFWKIKNEKLYVYLNIFCLLKSNHSFLFLPLIGTKWKSKNRWKIWFINSIKTSSHVHVYEVQHKLLYIQGGDIWKVQDWFFQKLSYFKWRRNPIIKCYVYFYKATLIFVLQSIGHLNYNIFINYHDHSIGVGI